MLESWSTYEPMKLSRLAEACQIELEWVYMVGDDDRLRNSQERCAEFGHLYIWRSMNRHIQYEVTRQGSFA